MFRSIGLLVGGLVSLAASSLAAQDAVLGQSYGSGVHAYFSGDAMGAYEKLTAAIDGGSKDPRAFYFRGLAYLKLGRGPEAAMDFRKAAELESQDVNRSYNVGKALERVQGSARQELENYRVAARMAALEEAERMRKARYESLRREEERVLREQAAAASDKAVRPVPSPAASDPFATPTEGPAAKSGQEPVKPPAVPAAKPPAKPIQPAQPVKKPADEKKPDAGKKAPSKPNHDDPFAAA
jgi:hypothetical protein